MWQYVYEVLLHETIHVFIQYVLGGHTGESSHNCPEWVEVVNQLSPAIGIDLHADRSRLRRKRAPGAQPSQVQRVSESYVGVCGMNLPIPFNAISSWPYGVRRLLPDGLAHYQTPPPVPRPRSPPHTRCDGT